MKGDEERIREGGCEAYLSKPISVGKSSRPSAISSAPHEGASMTARVLVVDDVPGNVRLLEARLSAEYLDVSTAYSGAEALALCERAECDIVLLDVMMPDMDGFEVCRRLKSNPLTHHIPVVMVTALDQPSDRVKGLEAGADDFLTKPVTDVALVSRVRSLARLKMVTDELRMRALTSARSVSRTRNAAPSPRPGATGHILIVDDRQASYAALSRRYRPNMLSMSKPIQPRRCFMPPKAITILLSCRLA